MKWFAALSVGISLFAGSDPIRIDEAGQGPAVVFLGALGTRGEVWNPVVDSLSKHYRCLTVSIAGFGGIRAVMPPDFGGVQAAIVRAITERKLGHPVLVGHSFGGYLAIMLAASNPDLFAKLVIVDAYPFPMGLLKESITPEDAKQQATAFKQILLGQTDEQFKLQQAQILRLLIADPSHQEAVLGWTTASDRAWFAEAQSLMLASDLRPLLPGISIPTLVLGAWHGREPLGFTREKVEQALKWQYQSLRRCTISIAGTARHFIMLDDPAWLAAQIEDFTAQ